jgi:acyl carrier protein
MTAKVPIPDHVFEAVRRCVADSLALDPDSIRLESRLIDDLDADSLDFVDIIFMLEKQIDVQMRENEMNFLTRLDFSSPEVMNEGYLTPAVIAKLEPWLPAISSLPDPEKISPRELFSLITIEAICLAATRQLTGASKG